MDTRLAARSPQRTLGPFSSPCPRPRCEEPARGGHLGSSSDNLSAEADPLQGRQGETLLTGSSGAPGP